MTDIFENTILCEKCDKKTNKVQIIKDGFTFRAWECPNCGKQWIHPLDKQEYENFSKIKNKVYSVKLRMVGNSYTVSIPREIIDFQEEMQSEFEKMDKLIKMCLEEPEKLSIFFTDKEDNVKKRYRIKIK